MTSLGKVTAHCVKSSTSRKKKKNPTFCSAPLPAPFAYTGGNVKMEWALGRGSVSMRLLYFDVVLKLPFVVRSC